MRTIISLRSPSPAHRSQPPPRSWLASTFAALFGAFLGLSLLKFGNPPIMEKWVSAPTDIYEFILGCPWPLAWAFPMLGLVSVLGVIVARRRERTGAQDSRSRASAPSAQGTRPIGSRALRTWVLALPLIWLAWQVLAGMQSVDPQITAATIKYFCACVCCFFLGVFSLAPAQRLWPFWLSLFGGLLLVLVVGWEQQFGGLEETRRYFFKEIYPTMKQVPPDYLKKISSNRIFSTLFYPNALAGSQPPRSDVYIGLDQRGAGC